MRTKTNWLLRFCLPLLAVVVLGLVLSQKTPKPVFAEQVITPPTFADGDLNGRNEGTKTVLKTHGRLTYLSPRVATHQPTANAVAVDWRQAGGNAQLEVRTFDGDQWRSWQPVSTDDLKDSAVGVHAGLLLTKNAASLQYRIVAVGSSAQPAVIRDVHLRALDTTVGPDPTRHSLLGSIFGSTAQATPEGPSVISRKAWGCPEGSGSPSWPPAYYPLTKAIVHHTAADGDAYGGAAAVRAIWYYHARTLKWGDIGYNYVVDADGKIFQGRSFSAAYAAEHNVDVEGGHSYGSNKGSTGISALGQYTHQYPSSPLMRSISNIIAFKLAKYHVTPYSSKNVVGHRNVYSTNCPGNNLYNNLSNIRRMALPLYNTYYHEYQHDYAYVAHDIDGHGATPLTLRTGETANLTLDLKNTGKATWHSDGTTPVRLGTDRPLSHSSQLADGTWLAPNQPASFVGTVASGILTPSTTVAPGETGRFTWQITAPNLDASLHAYFRPFVSTQYWFPRDLGIWFPITVVADHYTYQYLEHRGSVPNEPAREGTLELVVKNTGNVDWHSDGANPVRLATSQPNDRASSLHHADWLSTNRVATFSGTAALNPDGSVQHDGSGDIVWSAGTTVAPGEAAYFRFPVMTPSHVQVGKEHFNLVATGITWMKDIGLYWPVNLPQNYHDQYVSRSAYPTISKSSDPVGSAYLDLKNTGTYPWRKDGLVRLATYNPKGRSSLFAASGLAGSDLPDHTANWLSASRVGTFAGKVSGGIFDESATVINPGETARFYIAFDASDVAARTTPYREYFGLVAEGFAWLENPGIFFDVKVSS